MPIRDQDHIVQALKGNQLSYSHLHERHAAALLSYAGLLAESLDDADDIAQAAWIAAFRNLKGYRGGASFLTWISKIARNVALQEQRRCRRTTGPSSCDLYVDDTSEDYILRKIDFEHWYVNLPDRMREVVELVLEGHTHRTIGERLKIDEGTSKSQLYKALRRKPFRRLPLQ